MDLYLFQRGNASPPLDDARRTSSHGRSDGGHGVRWCGHQNADRVSAWVTGATGMGRRPMRRNEHSGLGSSSFPAFRERPLQVRARTREGHLRSNRIHGIQDASRRRSRVHRRAGRTYRWRQPVETARGITTPFTSRCTLRMHPGSWARVPEEGGRSLSYREIAPRLAEHVKQLGFTQLSCCRYEHPFYCSLGIPDHGILRAVVAGMDRRTICASSSTRCTRQESA